jgi:hypothetical protein
MSLLGSSNEEHVIQQRSKELLFSVYFPGVVLFGYPARFSWISSVPQGKFRDRTLD